MVSYASLCYCSARLAAARCRYLLGCSDCNQKASVMGLAATNYWWLVVRSPRLPHQVKMQT